MRDFLIGNFLIVHSQHAGAALAEAGPVVLEIKDNSVPARHECLCDDRSLLPLGRVIAFGRAHYEARSRSDLSATRKRAASPPVTTR